jgi:hypothetical protein
MTVIRVVAMEPEHFGVQVDEGDTTIAYRVELPNQLLDDLALIDVEPSVVVEESIGFLLDREPATSILDEFSIEDIPKHFPDFYDELRARLS